MSLPLCAIPVSKPCLALPCHDHPRPHEAHPVSGAPRRSRERHASRTLRHSLRLRKARTKSRFSRRPYDADGDDDGDGGVGVTWYGNVPCPGPSCTWSRGCG
jgi:hypothetical protein